MKLYVVCAHYNRLNEVIVMSTRNIQLMCIKSTPPPSKLSLLASWPWLTFSSSNYPCLEQCSMAPKMFKLLKFDCVSLHSRDTSWPYTPRKHLVVRTTSPIMRFVCVLIAPHSSKIDIFIQERFNKLIHSINMIINCGIWQPEKFQLVSRFWNG